MVKGMNFNSSFMLSEFSPPEDTYTQVYPRIFIFAQFTPDMKRDNQSRTIISGKYQLIRYFDAGRTVAYPLVISPARFSAHLEREKTLGVRP
jgi:hypothetical protein